MCGGGWLLGLYVLFEVEVLVVECGWWIITYVVARLGHEESDHGGLVSFEFNICPLSRWCQLLTFLRLVSGRVSGCSSLLASAMSWLFCCACVFAMCCSGISVESWVLCV